MTKRPSAHVIEQAIDNVDSTRMHTVKETADLINLTAEYVRDLIHMGRIEAVKPFGGHFRISAQEVKRVLRGMLNDGVVPPVPVDEFLVPQAIADKIFPRGNVITQS